MEPLQHLLAAALVLTTFCCSACAGPERPATKTTSAPPVTEAPVPVRESFTKYEALRTELIAALEQEMPSIGWTVKQPVYLTRLDDGRCILGTETIVSSVDVVQPSHSFADIFSAGDPVLAKYGFPAFGGTDPTPGGWTVTRSMDAAGAILSIESKSPAYLSITAPVDSETCDPAELPDS
jgi:hypothetical protein